MPRYIIHIGPPKAGSKYIQTSLASLGDTLKVSGILYPTALFSPEPQVWHSPLCAQLRAGKSNRLESIFRELNSSDYQYVIFSFEGFFGLTKEQLFYLKALLDGSEVNIVYYTRRWSERIPSLWKQNVKEGFASTFPEYYTSMLQALVRAPDLNPLLVWEKFSEVFGRESIRLVSFNNILEHHIDLALHFLQEFAGWSGELPSGKVLSNESPNTVDSEILRALNAIHIQRHGVKSDKVRIRFLRDKNTLDLSLLGEAMAGDLMEVVIDDQAHMFDAVYNGLKEYLDCLVSAELGRTFFSQARVPFKFVRQDYLLNNEVISELNRLYDTFGL